MRTFNESLVNHGPSGVRSVELSRISRKGSALLIVLGMLSFMVVSAVAFSAFMRQGRLPSSFLRQRILSRQLVKAGLAQAMTEIDEAIGDAPYPGEQFGNASNKNYWRNRVYLGYTGNQNEGYDYDSGLKETVSTFPLEGLAYIPPPLVNTVRHWSRRSSAAVWKNLDYDSGRWAFTAINISDYLDINRLRANVMRDSSPSNRLSLAFLFENEGHTDWGEVEPKKFDQFVDKATSDGSYGRLVSLADYALAIGNGRYGDIGFKSPFYEFIRNPSGDGNFYGSTEQTAKIQKFVTDSWYPGTNAVNQLALSDWVNGQPFEGKQQSLDDLQRGGGSRAFSEVFVRRLDLAALGALYDYIDEDNVPISLAMPTLERAPMLTGIHLSPFGFAMTLNSKEREQLIGQNKKSVYKTWSVETLGNDPKLMFSACGVYPFKRKSGLTIQSSYKVQVLVKAFLSDVALTDTRARGAESYRTGNWTSENSLMAGDKAYVTVVGEGTANIQQNILTPNQTLFDITPIIIPFPANAAVGANVYGTRTDSIRDPDTGFWTTQEAVYDPTDMATPLLYRNGNQIRNVRDAGETGPALRMNFVFWVRILDNEGNTVDLVPATTDDDQLLNGHNSGTASAVNSRLCGLGEPILPISTDPITQFDLATFTGGNGVQPANPAQGSLAIYCDDPRFNYAPEDWYLASGNDVQSATWLSTAEGRCDGSDHRQNDIFQFVASQGYLQSMGELQFLPYTRSFQNGGSPIEGAFYDSGKYNGQPFETRKSPNDLANNQYAWKTHWGFGPDADWREGDDCSPYNWGISDSNGGAAVSPYADQDLFMAALANTPYDYIVASEKENENDRDLDKNYELCFNEASSEAKLSWVQLQQIAVQLRAKLLTGQPWEQWNEWDQDNFFGQNIQNFDDVDRKFLFSYWKPCFGNNQQLFLVFVRAEPTVIGGSSAGHTPSQLGARAVALVWREPVSSINQQIDMTSGSTYRPHCMRILFYHQFE